ncbi:MAG: ABC transporter ATP-binding protein [Gemmataceae bacterium]
MARRRKSQGPEDLPAPKLSGESLRAARWLARYLGPHKSRLAIALVALCCSSAMGLIFPFASGRLVDVALGKSDIGSVNSVALFIFAVLAVQAVCSFFSSYNFMVASERALAEVRRNLYARLIRLPMAFFSARRVGELTGRVSGDISKIEDFMISMLPHMLRQCIFLAGGVTLIALISGKLTLVMLAVIPPLILVAILFGRQIRKVAKEIQDRLADTNVIVEETLQGVATVKAFGNEPFEVDRYRKGLFAALAAALRGARLRSLFVAFIIFALFGGLVMVMWYGARMVASGDITPGQLTSFGFYTVFVAGALGSFADIFSTLQHALGATERVREILLEQPEVLPEEMANEPMPRCRGDVRFEDVHFRYPSRTDSPVLRGLKLEARAGQKVALVGPSGAGKSTAVSLLMRFYDPDAGRILIDDRDIRELSLAELRAQVAVVPQDVLLFGGTISENIAYGKPGATDAEIAEAARKAYAHDFISEFPEGYQTRVGERGVQLSGGQRQRIAIARAILRNPAILILDEATSSLDAESERLVQQALDALMQGRTAVIIAHRLATIRRVDRIYVLQEGRAVESGTHTELAERVGGLYQSLARLQFGEITP